MRILFFAHLKSLTDCAEIDLPADDLDSAQLWALLLARSAGAGRLARGVIVPFVSTLPPA